MISGDPKCESCGRRIPPGVPKYWDEQGVYWHTKCPPKKPKPQPAPGKRRKVRIPPVIKFLLGEGSLDGVWYGAGAPSGRGPYWWRKKLRAAIGRLPIGRGRGGK